MALYFVFFAISGFCGILYELVWLRLAMAQFGITTPLISIFISSFMGGLGAGSWLSGRILSRYERTIRFPAIRLYAFAELLIGFSAFLLPLQFSWGHKLLQSIAVSSVSSAVNYAASGVLIVISVVPWCACMGATIPLAMASIRAEGRAGTGRSFSFLYLSNVVGAVVGTFGPLLLIEKHGFRYTSAFGAVLNFTVAFLAVAVGTLSNHGTSAERSEPVVDGPADHRILLLLFMTGLTTMAMEVVWIRLFTVFLGPLVYSFALILCSYLFGTFIGSCVYRDASAKIGFKDSPAVWVSIPLFASLPLLFADPRLPVFALFRPLVAIAPFAAAVGYLTPSLVDRWAIGDPERAGHAYAINIVGCIVGPLLCGFVLLPHFGEHLSIVLLVTPWLLVAAPWRRFRTKPGLTAAFAALAICFAILIFTKDYGILFSPRTVLRDSTATVTATGVGMRRQLLVNGTGMTMLQPTTKMMAHLTLASLHQIPRNALVICFGMGTTHRSVISWHIPSTVVELVPSVPKLFGFYHSDARQVLESPLSSVIVDDGRRYLERSTKKYDAIIIDPPPPVWAAGSSLLYSKEFYGIAKKHLSDEGILQQWLPGTGETEQASVARALNESFPYVRVLPALEPTGWHFLASNRLIPQRTAKGLAERMPPSAIADMLEWGPAHNAEQQFQLLLSKEMKISELIQLAPQTPALEDNRPINEYFLMRTLNSRKPVSTTTDASHGTH